MPTWDARDPLARAAVAEIVAAGQALQASHDGHAHRWNAAHHRIFTKWFEQKDLAHDCELCAICQEYKCEVDSC